LKKWILWVCAILLGILIIGLKPTQAEFVCLDSTSRCNDTWASDFWVPVNKKEIHLGVYGYEIFNRSLFWLVFISERNTDIVTPKATRVSWMGRPFQVFDLIPKLAIKKIEDANFRDRYELTYDDSRVLKLIMGNRRQYYNPFRFENGKFVEGVW
jgi:hypothetical protein